MYYIHIINYIIKDVIRFVKYLWVNSRKAKINMKINIRNILIKAYLLNYKQFKFTLDGEMEIKRSD